jgi:hypothetical protein
MNRALMDAVLVNPALVDPAVTPTRPTIPTPIPTIPTIPANGALPIMTTPHPCPTDGTRVPAQRSRIGRRGPGRPLAAAAAAALALVLVASACGDDASSSTSATTSDRATNTTLASHDTAAHHATVDVTAVDFAFEDLPETIAAGTQLTLTNGATTELHELVAFRLPAGETRPIGALLALPPAELGALLGAAPPATVLLAPPGGEQISAVGDGTLTEPGRYLIMCSIPTGVDPAVYLAAAAQSNGAPPQVEGGPPHFVQGMAADLTVE